MASRLFCPLLLKIPWLFIATALLKSISLVKKRNPFEQQVLLLVINNNNNNNNSNKQKWFVVWNGVEHWTQSLANPTIRCNWSPKIHVLIFVSPSPHLPRQRQCRISIQCSNLFLRPTPTWRTRPRSSSVQFMVNQATRLSWVALVYFTWHNPGTGRYARSVYRHSVLCPLSGKHGSVW